MLSNLRKIVIFGVFAAALNLAVFGQTEFKVKVENISPAAGVTADDGTLYPFALSPGVFVASKNAELFRKRTRAFNGIESLAEDGNPTVLAAMLQTKLATGQSGVFDTPVGGGMPSPIFAGGVFEFTFVANKDDKFNFAVMYGQSNDLFYSFEKPVDLFKRGKPISGDISNGLVLWDAGTEVNQAPGKGADQGPRQASANIGKAENGVIRPVKDGFKYPETASVIRISITAN